MPPKITELLVGPWMGLQIYPRAAALKPTQALGVLLLVTLACGSAMTGKWYLRRSSQLEETRDSQLYLMPRVSVEEGVARIEGSPGRLLDAHHFLLWLDDTTNVATELPLSPGETRPVVHVGKDALIVHRLGQAPEPLPWRELNKRYGALSMNGAELIDWLAAELPGRAMERFGLGIAAACLWQLFLLTILSALYRVLFWRGLYVPRFKTLLAVGAVASGPAVVLAAASILIGLGQGVMLSVHALGVGVLFLIAATRVRLGDEQSTSPSAPEETPSD